MVLQRIIPLLVARAMDFITRLACAKPAAFAFEPPSAANKRLLFVSSFSFCLALALVWVGAGLPRPDGLRAAFAAGTTRYIATTGVDTLNNCSIAALPCLTVQHAADQSSAGDEIRIAGGAYNGVSVRDMVTQVVYISQSLTLRGGYTTTDSFAAPDPVANQTILDAQLNTARVLFITGTNVSGYVENLTVQNGHIGGNGTLCPAAGCGGGIYVNGDLVVSNTTIVSNSATFDGGGAYIVGTLTLISTQFLGNTGGSGFVGTSHGGGGAYASGAAMLNAGLFQNNSAFFGGGLYTLSDLTLTDTQFLSNKAGGGGGGAYARGGTELNGGLFQNNTVFGGYGGGLNAGPSALSGTQFLSNTAAFGGGGADVFEATLIGGLFQNNTTSGFGGGLNAFRDLTLTGTQFLNNRAGAYGGGALAGGAATLDGGLFQNNTADNGGGGLAANNTLALTGTRFLHNTAGSGGVGGGGLRLAGGAGRIVNALFARNVAGSTLGAALSLNSTDTVQVLHTTIANPTLTSGTAIFISAGTVGITDTIIARYGIGISNTNGSVYENYNLFFANGTDHVGTTGGTNDVTGNPKFVNPPADDYHLGVGSAAIDSGVDVGVRTDFEGDRRPIGNGFDIGYDERLLYLYLPLVRR